MNKYERLLVLAKEAVELNERLEKLKYYYGQEIGRDRCPAISEKARDMLQEQGEAMRQYLDILGTRILCFVGENNFEKKPDTEGSDGS